MTHIMTTMLIHTTLATWDDPPQAVESVIIVSERDILARTVRTVTRVQTPASPKTTTTLRKIL